MKVIVKKAEKKDIPSIYEVTMKAFKEYAKGIGLPDQVSALKEDYKSIEKDMKDKLVLVACQDEKILGTIRCEILEKESIGYISRFGVMPDAHNLGIGKALLLEVEKEVRKKGLKGLSLHTASKMSNLVTFYYKMGFFIHSTSTDRGYIRASFMKEF